MACDVARRNIKDMLTEIEKERNFEQRGRKEGREEGGMHLL